MLHAGLKHECEYIAREQVQSLLCGRAHTGNKQQQQKKTTYVVGTKVESALGHTIVARLNHLHLLAIIRKIIVMLHRFAVLLEALVVIQYGSTPCNNRTNDELDLSWLLHTMRFSRTAFKKGRIMVLFLCIQQKKQMSWCADLPEALYPLDAALTHPLFKLAHVGLGDLNQCRTVSE